MGENSEAEMTGRQCDYIVKLLDGRRVSQKLASRIIQALEKQPKISDNGLDDLQEKLDRKNT